jgi:tetratricopeptide (TPR) repeat protein
MLGRVRVTAQLIEARTGSQRWSEHFDSDVEAYLRGLQSENRQSRESTEAAVADFQQALALDPSFAPAAIGLARSESFIGAEGWLPTRNAFERAREAAQLAQRLAPKSPEPHISLAEIHTYYDWDWDGAERELQERGG